MLAHRLAVAVLVVSPLASTPARSQNCEPEIVNTFNTPGEARRFAVSGDLLAVADGGGGVRFLDISDPTSIRQLSWVPVIFGAQEVAISGSIAAFIDTNGLNAIGDLGIVDISDPRNPEVVYLMRTEDAKPTAVGAWDNIVALSLFAYGVRRLELYDVTDPSDPQLLSMTKATPIDMHFRDGMLFAAQGTDGLIIYDVTDPTAPTVVGSLEIPEFARRLSISGDIAYVTTGEEGLFIIDIADPASPRLLSTILTTGLSNTVVTIGTTAYVSFSPNPTGLDAIDVRDPLNPVLIGSIDGFAGAVRGVAIADDQHLLLANCVFGVHTIDISTCQPCPADLTGSSDPDDDSYGVPDGDADSDDFFFYLDSFATGDFNICDIDNDADCDADDFFAYLELFAQGC